MNRFTDSTPAIRLYVRNKYLGLTDNDITEAYLLSVTSVANRPLMFTVHLETGALWSRLPITALYMNRYLKHETVPTEMSLELAQPFTCLDGSIQVIAHPHLKNYEIIAKMNNEVSTGHYLFTVDVVGDGLAEDPVQFKTHNICVLNNGNLIAYPNNYLLFKDGYFTEKLTEMPAYKRQDVYYHGSE